MISSFNTMRASVTGAFAVLSFKPDWRRHFDISAEGVAGSFSGIIWGLPALVMLVAGIGYYVDSNPMLPVETRITTLEAVIIWARYWLVFPISAALTAYLFGATHRYGSWLVVHNWANLVMIYIQSLIFLLYTAGIADTAALAGAMNLYLFARLFVYWRVAHAVLELPLGKSFLAGGLPLLIYEIVRAVT